MYGIAYDRERPRRELVQAAVTEAALRSPQPPVSEARYGVGFGGVVGHEREAWVRYGLANPGGPDLDAYLADRLSGHL
jgi:hypothetical protein